MAIKMDGHVITALKLKDTNGNEITKQLTEEGGGGSASGYELLKTVTVDTAAHQIDFVWETDWEQYDTFVIVCTATLSADDYLYFGFAPSKTSDCEYINRSTTSFDGLSDISIFTAFFSKITNKLYRGATGANAPREYPFFESGGTAHFFTYTASVNIQSGSVFKIYGAKLPTV